MKLKLHFTKIYTRLDAQGTGKRAIISFFRQPKMMRIVQKKGFRAELAPATWHNAVNIDLWLFQIGFSFQTGRIIN